MWRSRIVFYVFFFGTALLAAFGTHTVLASMH